eukprot:TRINITY_DN5469_c0_g1_i1.p1 TRINITY_DN5469_c0_g1~~TRINITY_DN5469_c0_g1_i1.p1  ORF type:complete len:226 (+),score=72.43 TRINITY_DN5469_c0_g1_i1:33-680(+)
MNLSSTNQPTKIKLYTKTGDKGTSMLFNGERLSKNSIYFDALGNTDELNAQIGVALEHCIKIEEEKEKENGLGEKILSEKLISIQNILIDLGSCIATPLTTSNEKQIERTQFEEGHIDTIEKWIDQVEEKLPPLRNFILPSGGLASSHLHVARSVCRRLERSLIPMLEEGSLRDQPYIFVNRLSDFFFAAARFAAQQQGKEERIHKKEKPAKKIN